MIPGGSSGSAAYFAPPMQPFWNWNSAYQHIAAAAGFPPTVGPPTSPLPYQAGGLQPLQMQQLAAAASMISGAPMSALSPPSAPSPTFPPGLATPSPPTDCADCIGGTGLLVWLSSQAGLIRNPTDGSTVSFQLKHFCDQAVTDLTAVLRPGFSLKYQAVSADGHSWLATFVAPVHGAGAQPSADQVNLEAAPGAETGPPQVAKDPYSLELESRAVPMLLELFARNGQPQCQLSALHCQISNCGDEDLYRYVGTSSLKRRQFLERRSHIFCINQHDVVALQPAAVYSTVGTLAHRLLTRGGACLMQELFDHFNSCPDIPLEARDNIGDGKTQFLRFLQAHPWIFAVFPSRVFVSVRRNLPKFDYPAFMDECFGDQELRQPSPPLLSGYGAVTAPPAAQQQAPMPMGRPPSQSARANWPPLGGGASSVVDTQQPSAQPSGGFNTSTASSGYSSVHSVDGGAAHYRASQPSPLSLPAAPTSSNPNSTPATPLFTQPLAHLLADDYSTMSAAANASTNSGQPALPSGVRPSNFWVPGAGVPVGVGVGGRMKRFADVQVQTDGVETGGWLRSADTQTAPLTRTIGCGTCGDDGDESDGAEVLVSRPPLAVVGGERRSVSPRDSGTDSTGCGSSASPATAGGDLRDDSLFGVATEPQSPLHAPFADARAGFDPLFYDPFNLAGGLRHGLSLE